MLHSETPRVFLFCGEGAHSEETDIALLKSCGSWSVVEDALQQLGLGEKLEPFLLQNLGRHNAPTSPVVSVVLNILNADLWRRWGEVPSLVLGHSVGEIAAAYAAGIFTVAEALGCAHGLGLAMQNLPGAMLHVELQRKSLECLEDGFHVAALNYVVSKGATEEEDLLSVTLCTRGSTEAYLEKDPSATLLKPQHAWHHPACELPMSFNPPLGGRASVPFISAVTGTRLEELPPDHWQRWLRCPVNLASALQNARELGQLVVLEMGPHPVLYQAAKASFDLAGYACSMRRGEKQGSLLSRQRSSLPGFRAHLSSQLHCLLDSEGICFETSFADQGIASQKLVPLAHKLAKIFPTLAPHDLYRFDSVQKLIDLWDEESSGSSSRGEKPPANALDILACGVRLPAGVESPGTFWALLDQDDQDSAFSCRDGLTAAFLQPQFDHKAAVAAAEESGVEGAEAAAMDPQHALALKLARDMFQDAGEETLKAVQRVRERVGVYIGAWQGVANSGKPSAYHAIGASLSALAARVANAYDLQGPAVTVNTACSSALVAVNEALKDAKAGRIDFAIVGGVNLFGDEQLFHHLRRASMLSPSGRCHTFSAEADGYVRAEGGVLFLLAREALELPSHGRILGSAVTQNSRRKPLSSVDPIAQEHAVHLACSDAGIKPSELTVVELHGTGTPLGDPVEVSALARTLRERSEACWMTAAKMHVGHLESAAGAVGLLKAMLMCEQGKVPAFRIDGKGLNPQVMAAMEGSCLCRPGQPGVLIADAMLGVSSFGFAGSNAHVVMTAPKGSPAAKYESPFTATLSKPSQIPLPELSTTFSPRGSISETFCLTSLPKQKDGDGGDQDVEDVSVSRLSFVSSAVLSIVGGESDVDTDADLHELGVDSLGLAELLGLLEDKFGPGCITVERIMNEPTCRAIACNLEGFEAVPSIQAQHPQAPVVPAVMPLKPIVEVTSAPTAALLAAPLGEKPDPSCAWIRTTHVGSLPRPADGILDLNQVIAQQGCLDIINDGEWGRENYIADVINRISGLSGGDGAASAAPKDACCTKHAMPVAADMRDVPLYAQRFSGGNGLITLNPKREAVSGLACVAHPKYSPADIPNVKAFLTAVKAAGKNVSDCFYSVPSPGTMALFCRDLVFHDHSTYVMALADALSQEYQQIAKHGLLLQVDCPDLGMGRHTRWSDLSEAEFLDVARCNVAALNRALQEVPVEQVRVHVCWGNYAGPHHQDISAEHVWPLLGEVKAKYLLVEGANPRHRRDVQCFEMAVQKGYFKSHQVIVPGLIDTTTARVEDPRLIAEDLLRYVRAAGHPGRVVASTDCGFASTARSTAITADLAWMKLRSLAEGAQLATRHFLQQSAPVPCRSVGLASTPFRAVIFTSEEEPATLDCALQLRAALDGDHPRHKTLIFSSASAACDELRWMVDVPLAFVMLGEGSKQLAQAVQTQLHDAPVSRRPVTMHCFSIAGDVISMAEEVRREAMAQTSFDRRSLVIPRSNVPSAVDVVVIGAGLLGMLTAHRCTSAGFSVAVLEQRPVVGGIWSMYANGTSQVNSSEGGYCIKDLLGEEDGKAGDNRDHSTAAEVLKDLAKLGDRLKEHIFTSVKVMKVLGEGGNYTVLFDDELVRSAGIVQCRGVVLCINDRVGLPRPLCVPGQESFMGVMADGTSDSLAGINWHGKRVVIAGMGAFAVENVRTALEHGAAQVIVVARRHGTICPKAIDYLNFVKPWDEKYKHDTQTNVKQFLRWKQLYEASGCQLPECWPKQVKHDGHTISVSDIWFVAHHMKKLSTMTGLIQHIEKDGVMLSSGDFVPCDVVVGCIGFERSNFLCESLTGRCEVKTSNYLDQHMMYLADAEIDEGAFNSFFGSSVLEYGKFFTNVFVEGLLRPDILGERLWGCDTVSVPISQRKWNQYIASAMKLIETDDRIALHAQQQVEARTKHFWRTLPPTSFLAVNRKDWEELHERLNGGVPVPKEQQLPYFFEEIPAWC
ncbi:unnamed protein product [Cladocopium goreaui]|uniref:Polyketide synthase n=1 Tax=Cladocopium goreaui TaxID=2562237 RepID=A0A9P1C9D7_9DINO|nr:unnamed protein product [Cladocopium goreaui]